MTPDELRQKISTLQNSVVDRMMVMRAANAGVAIIRERTTSGKFLEGSSAGAEQYSAKPFARPLGGLTRNTTKALLASGSEIFTSKNKSTWIVVAGGYKRFRELAGKDSSHVSLTWTGRMLRNLGIISADDTGAVISEKDADMKKLATYHQVSGAGKSRRLHKFIGFTADEQVRLKKLVGEEVMKKIKAMIG